MFGQPPGSWALVTLRIHASIRPSTESLLAGYNSLRKNATPGVDGVTWGQYKERAETRLRELHEEVHSG